MPQFYLPFDSISGDAFRLEGPEAHHLVKVLRYREGQRLVLFDGKGGRFEGVIEKIGEDGSVSGKVTSCLTAQAPRAEAAVCLYQGLLKASHWDWVLEKGTELGAAAFVPVLTPRTVVLLREGAREAKKDRWSRLVMAAAKQCGRADLPEVREPVEFRDAIRALPKGGLALLAYEGLAGASAGETLRAGLREAVREKRETPLSVSLFVGPEGGFSPDEVELARGLGALIFGLGPRILRAETAALAALSLVQYELGQL